VVATGAAIVSPARRVDPDVLTDWIEAAGIVVLALGTGGAAAGAVLGRAVLGIGVWLCVTAAVLLASSGLLTWHNARKIGDQRRDGGDR
jgi:hypothetical protein